MSLAKEIESMLRERGMPYIAVEEAKKALFGGAKLSSFDFVVYFPEGANWLLSCAERRKEKLADMRQWGEIFGAGFKVVFAVRRADGIKFIDIDGEPVVLAADAKQRDDLTVPEGRIRQRAARDTEGTRTLPNLSGSFVPPSAAGQMALFGGVL